ncbi:hypothetical protein [Paraconexibacter sp.]|uniref:hypothetical protein n=1 Tax=Paraconexibacter sp. TaxID=2949640 RepID=UPI00356AECD0
MTPDLRATVRRDRVVRAVQWGPHLRIRGPIATLLDARGRAGVTVVDLTFLREDQDPTVETDELAALAAEVEEDGDEYGCGEPKPVTDLIVEVRCLGTQEGLDAIVEWADLVGYQRVWLSDGIVTLDPDPAPSGQMHTRCTGCRGRLVESADELTSFARTYGFFPLVCPICGCDMPQWTPVPDRAPAARRASTKTDSSAKPATLHGDNTDLRVSDLRSGNRR